MRTTHCLSPFALAACLAANGVALAADPPGSTPSAPPLPRDPGTSVQLPERGPTGLTGIEVPPGDLPDMPSDDDALVDELMGISVPLPPPSSEPLPSFVATGDDPGWQHLLEDGGCTWTNDNVAECLILECDSDEVCVEVGTYCVDHNGNQVPCP
jgi:hypothetical protein